MLLPAVAAAVRRPEVPALFEAAVSPTTVRVEPPSTSVAVVATTMLAEPPDFETVVGSAGAGMFVRDSMPDDDSTGVPELGIPSSSPEMVADECPGSNDPVPRMGLVDPSMENTLGAITGSALVPSVEMASDACA